MKNQYWYLLADVVDKVIDKQIELKPIIIDAQYRLLKDPDFFGQESISKIDLKLFEDIFLCNLFIEKFK